MQNFNLHTHSIYSDGKSQPREIVEEAIRQGLTTVGFYEDTLTEIRVDLGQVEQTVKGEYCSIPVKSLVRRGDKVYKVIKTEE